jgi:hypothetical protein
VGVGSTGDQAADVDGSLPPRQWLGLAEPVGIELLIGGMALEQAGAVVPVLQHLGDGILRAFFQKPVLHGPRASAHSLGVGILIPRHEQQPVPGQGVRRADGQVWPQLLQPSFRQLVFFRLAGEGQIAGNDDQIRC